MKFIGEFVKVHIQQKNIMYYNIKCYNITKSFALKQI